jgi:ABC-2 type transport system permease protein
MNIYWKEMRSGLKSLIFWSLGVMLFVAASMQKYSALHLDPASLNMLYQLPPALQDMFGVGYLDFTKISGFYGMIYPYLLLMAAVHASMLGAVILSKEERDKTGEFLYAKPASRLRILAAKSLAALTTVILLNLVVWAASQALIGTYGGGEDMGGALMTLMAGLFLIQLLFTALGVAAAAVMARPKAATGIATGVMLAMYLLSVAIDVGGNLGALKPFTPFQYFDARRIVGRGEGLQAWGVLTCLVLTAALASASCLRFSRRDLKL